MMMDDLRMLNVRGWRRRALDSREWKNILRLESGQGPNLAVEPLVLAEVTVVSEVLVVAAAVVVAVVIVAPVVVRAG
jgi:hypothetical protein